MGAGCGGAAGLPLKNGGPFLSAAEIFNREPNNVKDCNFRSVLRVPYAFCEKTRADKLLQKLAEGGFDSVMFFNTPTHDIVGRQRHRKYAADLQYAVNGVKKLDISAGIDVLSTIGHHMEARDPALDGMDFYVDMGGNVNRGVFCSSSQKTFGAIAEQYRIYAEMGVDYIYVDDDIDYHCGCMCEHCLREFEEKYGVFSGNGLPVGRTQLQFLFEKAAVPVRRAVRAAWLDYYTFRADRIFAIIERAVHEVDPSVALGFMPCAVGTSGSGAAKWSKTFSEGGNGLLVRPGGGLYTDFRPLAVMEKANNIGRQIVDVPADAKVHSEIENYPHQPLRKSPRYTAFEGLVYLNAGCMGLSYNFLSPSVCALEETEEFFAVAKRILPYTERFAQTFGRTLSEGIGCWWNKDTFTAPSANGETPLPFEDMYYNIGLPVCYHSEKMCAYVLNEASAAWIPQEQLRKMLSGGVLLDGDALGVLCERGFGRLVGFEKSEKFERNAVEYQTEHPLNPVPGSLRDAHLEFSINGHPEFGALRPAWSLKATGEGTQTLSVLKDYDGNDLGVSCGIFTNELGGRVCVVGYAPFDWWYTPAAVGQLKNIFRWLSGDTLPAYFASPVRAAVWARKTLQGEPGACVANLESGRLCGAKLRIRGRAKEAIFVYTDTDTVSECTLPCADCGGGYSEAVLPDMPPLSAGFAVLK